MKPDEREKWKQVEVKVAVFRISNRYQSDLSLHTSIEVSAIHQNVHSTVGPFFPSCGICFYSLIFIHAQKEGNKNQLTAHHKQNTVSLISECLEDQTVKQCPDQGKRCSSSSSQRQPHQLLHPTLQSPSLLVFVLNVEILLELIIYTHLTCNNSTLCSLCFIVFVPYRVLFLFYFKLISASMVTYNAADVAVYRSGDMKEWFRFYFLSSSMVVVVMMLLLRSGPS